MATSDHEAGQAQQAASKAMAEETAKNPAAVTKPKKPPFGGKAA
jgi:hypothetical protein